MIQMETLRPGGPCFYYDTEVFPPSTDSFLLGWFAHPRRGARVCDLGCGSGLLGTLLLARDETLRVENVERSGDALALARRGFAENGWEASFREGDLREQSVLPPAGSMDYCVCNPPYFRCGSGAGAAGAARRAAREESCTIEDVCAAAARILRWGGGFAAVYRPDRLTDLLCALRVSGIEPKRLRFFQKTETAAPSLVLAEGKRGGKPGLTVEKPLVQNGTEWDEIYFR